MSQFDIIVAGDCNVDLVFNHFTHIPRMGEEVIADKFELVLGSSAGITAAHLSALGAKVAFVGMIGDDVFGQQFRTMLESHGVCTDYMITRSQQSTGCTVVMSQYEDRANITHAGAMASLSPDDLPYDLIKETPYFHLSNPFVLPYFRDELPSLFKKIRQLDTFTSMDPQWDVEEKWNTHLPSLLPHLNAFLPNEEEINQLVKGNNVSLKNLKDYVDHTMVITKGHMGIELISPEVQFTFKGYRNHRPIDCIGAGDAFSAGYLAALIEGKPNTEAVALGCKSGALSTTVVGGQVPHRNQDEFNKLFHKAFPDY